MEWLSVKKPLSTNEVREIINRLNITLPDDYCDAIGSINGGALANATCNVPGVGEIAYSRNLSLLEGTRGNAIEIFRILQGVDTDLFPFGSVGNGDYFCFDLKKHSVVLYMHEKQTVHYVCGSFTEFLSSLSKA